jgi:hypothetical protein
MRTGVRFRHLPDHGEYLLHLRAFPDDLLESGT